MIRTCFQIILWWGLMAVTACQKPDASVDQSLTVLSYATAYGQNHPFSRADQTWMKWVEAGSDGEISIEPIWAGALLSSDMSMAELRHGVADIGLITPIYSLGGTHLIRTQTGFYSGIETISNQIALYRCLEAQNLSLQHELKGLKILAVQGGALPGILTKHRPIQSLEDFRGLEIRVPAELVDVMKELGANPVTMSMGDVYSALAKGVIDGVVAPEDTFRSLHFAEVAQHFTRLKIPRGAYPSRAISMRVWDVLTPSQQSLLESSIPIWEQAMIDEIHKAKSVGEKFGRDHGVKFYDFPTNEQEKFEHVYHEIARKNAQALSRFDIDGVAALNLMRASIMPPEIMTNEQTTNKIICATMPKEIHHE